MFQYLQFSGTKIVYRFNWIYLLRIHENSNNKMFSELAIILPLLKKKPPRVFTHFSFCEILIVKYLSWSWFKYLSWFKNAIERESHFIRKCCNLYTSFSLALNDCTETAPVGVPVWCINKDYISWRLSGHFVSLYLRKFNDVETFG